MKHVVALDEWERGKYEAPELPQSDVPALVGVRALERMHAVIEVHN